MLAILVIIVILFSAMVIHEYAHAWMALRLGDATAKEAGRLTLNPVKHVDPFGTLILPAVLTVLHAMGSPFFPVALAKPVPVNFRRLRNPKKDMIWVALAGPGVNIILAALLSLTLNLPMSFVVFQLIVMVIFINILLAVFNMIPIPPLDGSRVLMGLLPRELALPYSRIEPYGILIIFALLPFGLFEYIVLPVSNLIGKTLGVVFP